MNRLFIAICTIAIFLAGQTNALLDAPLSPAAIVSLPLLDGPDGGLLNLRRSLPVLGGMTDSLPLVGGDGGLLNLRRSLPVLGDMTDSLPLVGGDGGLLNLRRSLPILGGMTDSLPLVGEDGGLLNLRRSLPVLGDMTDSLPLVGGDGGLLNLRRGMPGLDTLGSLPGMDALTGAIPQGFMKVRRSKAVVDDSREARAPELLAGLLGKAAPTAAGLTETLDKVGV